MERISPGSTVDQGFLYTKMAGRELVVWLMILIFPPIFIGSGLKFLMSSLKELDRARKSASWTPTTGTIERVLIPARTGKRRNVRVVYRYSVHRMHYRSERIAFGSIRMNDIMARADRYHPGDAVPVFVDPQDPTLSVLETGSRPGNLIWPAFGGGLIVIGVLLGWYIFWNTRPSSDWARRNEIRPWEEQSQ